MRTSDPQAEAQVYSILEVRLQCWLSQYQSGFYFEVLDLSSADRHGGAAVARYSCLRLVFTEKMVD